MAEHYKGKLIVDMTKYGGSISGKLLFPAEKNEPHVCVCIARIGDYDTAEANARRFAALWNAAHELNLSTEAIEAGAIQSWWKFVQPYTQTEAGAPSYTIVPGDESGWGTAPDEKDKQP